jgi:hypothetical protein
VEAEKTKKNLEDIKNWLIVKEKNLDYDKAIFENERREFTLNQIK